MELDNLNEKDSQDVDRADRPSTEGITHPADSAATEKIYPPKKVVLPTMIALFLVFFLVALDRTIIGTAIPTISAEFDSFGDIAWYESAFLLPLCVFQLSFGLVFKYYSTKWVLFTLAAIFEIGSIVCAAAPTSNALIVGRAITGIGGAGIGSGAFIYVTVLFPLEERPKYLGALGAAFGLSSILGPILGGYLTSVTWRWCFWINVPIGGLSLFLLCILAPNRPPPSKPADTWLQRFFDLDPLGFVLVAGSISSLLFALEFGKENQEWSSGRVIALFVVFGVLLLIFAGYQVWRGEKATIPPRILKQRTVLVACLFGFAVSSVLVVYPFYLPVWFQVVKGKSSQDSGIALLPLLLSSVLMVMLGGVLVSKIGYYTPFAIGGAATMVVGSALFTTWTADVSTGKWVGYQMIAGAGMGLALQQSAIAIQTVLSDSDSAVGLSILNFVNFFGGTIFITVSQSLFQGQLQTKITTYVPDIDIQQLTNSGAAGVKSLVPADKMEVVLGAYNDSMKAIWYLALGLACAALLVSFGFEWRTIKTDKKKPAKQPSEDCVAV
ncbi:major facilitator superfamily domain-containing protein [Fusarium tricinctum]|uniref:Major facilitator superfamily domain-containing protein n=1 Tax=Fusarium tricinctum TaxID=61284 RepID=A0A8K0WBA1_9HYPO|nr:major facilitator superfamily domain-containing protein [Fusarium tricinctum]